MCEVRRMFQDDISKLMKNILLDINLRNWNEEEFKKAFADINRIIYIIDDFAFLEIANNYDEAEIYMVWVAPQMRSKGYGQKILEFMLNEIKEMNIANIFLEVAVNNINAIKLYEKNGFVHCGIRKNYYKKFDNTYLDAFKMHKQICKKA